MERVIDVEGELVALVELVVAVEVLVLVVEAQVVRICQERVSPVQNGSTLRD